MKDKIKAFSIHLLLSSILALICLFLMFFVWYPSPLIQATGVGKLFLMMLAIDLILGPILTFIIYQKNHPEKIRKKRLSEKIQFSKIRHTINVTVNKSLERRGSK